MEKLDDIFGQGKEMKNIDVNYENRYEFHCNARPKLFESLLFCGTFLSLLRITVFVSCYDLIEFIITNFSIALSSVIL